MSESEIWQIIQTGNEISVLRIEVFITITVGVLVISSLRMVQLNLPLMLLMLGSYVVFGFINFSMTISEMEILTAGMAQLRDMQRAGVELSYMGQYLVRQTDTPLSAVFLPMLYAIYVTVTLATVAYSIWRYRVGDAQADDEARAEGTDAP